MGRVKSSYDWLGSGKLAFWDGSTYETLWAGFPVSFYDDFLGYQFELAESGNQAVWSTVATNLNTSPALVADTQNGVVQITLDSDDNAEHGVLYWGDQNSIDLNNGAIFECRLTFETLPTTGGKVVEAVWGLADDNNTTLDSIATNAWFKVVSSAQTTLLYESDDGDTDDDDNDAGTTLVEGTYNIYRIDATDPSNVRFYVDGAYVGGTDMSELTAAEGMVQPFFCLHKDATSSTGTGTMYIDYVKIWQNRS